MCNMTYEIELPSSKYHGFMVTVSAHRCFTGATHMYVPCKVNVATVRIFVTTVLK